VFVCGIDVHDQMHIQFQKAEELLMIVSGLAVGEDGNRSERQTAWWHCGGHNHDAFQIIQSHGQDPLRSAQRRDLRFLSTATTMA
jgi:hypothetical protein